MQSEVLNSIFGWHGNDGDGLWHLFLMAYNIMSDAFGPMQIGKVIVTLSSFLGFNSLFRLLLLQLTFFSRSAGHCFSIRL